MKKFLFLLALIIVAIPLTAQWSSSPNENTLIIPGSESQLLEPQFATDPVTGDNYVQWFNFEYGQCLPKIQKLNSQGVVQWQDNGMYVSTNPNESALYGTGFCLTSDGCPIVFFPDIRDGNYRPYIYKLSPDGEFLWGQNGIKVFDVDGLRALVTPCHDGSVYVCWLGYSDTGKAAYIRHIGVDGSLGNIITINDADFCHLRVDEDNNLFAIYFLNVGGSFMYPDRITYAAKYNSSGQLIEGPTVILSRYSMLTVRDLEIVEDNYGGYYVATYIADLYHETYVAHFDVDCNLTTPVQGVKVVPTSVYHHYYPTLAVDEETNNLFVFFLKADYDENYTTLFGQMLTPTGDRLWGNLGIELQSTVQTIYTNLTAHSIPGGGAFVTFSTYFNNIYGMRVKNDGTMYWDEPFIDIAISYGDKSIEPCTPAFYNDQIFLYWNDERNISGIYAQNIYMEDGSLGIKEAVLGDANDDGVVNILDIEVVIAYILLHNPSPFVFSNADANEDGAVNVLDIFRIVEIIIQ